jgi:phage tail-like protein
MARQRFDPLQAFCFSVTLDLFQGDGGTVAFCKSVSGLKVEREPIPYKEGGNNRFTQKLVGPTNHPNIVLKRGFVSGGGGHRVFATQFFEMLKNDGARRFGGTIVQLGPDLQPKWEWKFKEGWICKWEGPDLDASKSELSFESIEIAHHGFEISSR